MAPINQPLGTVWNGLWTGYRLTTGKHYLLLPHQTAQRLLGKPLPIYWRFMARQLRRIGINASPAQAWRLFAD